MSDQERDFEDMTDPPLADRLRAFEAVLEAEPCTGPPGVPDDTPYKIGGCIVLSKSRRMCAACRLRLRFRIQFYHAEAYEGGLGEIPRR